MFGHYLEFLTFRTLKSFHFHHPDRNALPSSASGASFPPTPAPLAAWACLSSALTRAAETFPICFRWLLSCSKCFTAPIKKAEGLVNGARGLSCKTVLQQYLCSKQKQIFIKKTSESRGFCASGLHPSSSPCQVNPKRLSATKWQGFAFSWDYFSFEMNIPIVHVLLHLWKAFIGRGLSL